MYVCETIMQNQVKYCFSMETLRLYFNYDQLTSLAFLGFVVSSDSFNLSGTSISYFSLHRGVERLLLILPACFSNRHKTCQANVSIKIDKSTNQKSKDRQF